MLLNTKRIVLSSDMQSMDKKTIQEFKLPGEVLMENAGRTASEIIFNKADTSDKKIIILCGPGNNGGDGFVMARYLHKRSKNLEVVLMCQASKLKGDALLNYERAKDLDIKITEYTKNRLTQKLKSKLLHNNIIVDALFGTGLKSAPRGIYKEVIAYSNSIDKFIAAVDIPSGIDADTGKILDTAFKADITITFGFPKPLHYLNPGKEFSGEIYCVDIGIPEKIYNQFENNINIIDKEHVINLLPKRERSSHKGNFGHLLVIGGSANKTGAVVMSSKAAHRSGGGLITLCYPKSCKNFFCYDETMKSPLPDKNGEFSKDAVKILEPLLKNKSAIVIGPGMGVEKGACKIVSFLLENRDIPMVLDADALNILAKNRELLPLLNKNILLTPHPKEMARLCNKSLPEIMDDQIKTAKDFALKYRCSLILKTSTSVIASHDGKIMINTTGNSGMSTGGSGDILAGIAGAMLSSSITPFDAGCLSAFIHGFSADILYKEKGPFGYLPVETAENLPNIFKILKN